MKVVKNVEFSETEKRAIKNCVETISCEEMDCDYCPFSYNCGCMLETLREAIED